jgi:hypothetical protein
MSLISKAFLDSIDLDNSGSFAWHEIWVELEALNG